MNTARGFTEPLLALLCEGFELSALWAKSFEYRQRLKELEGRRQPIALGISEPPFFHGSPGEYWWDAPERDPHLGQGTHEALSQPPFPQIPTDSAWGAGGECSTDYQEDCAVRLKIIGPPNQDLVTER